MKKIPIILIFAGILFAFGAHAVEVSLESTPPCLPGVPGGCPTGSETDIRNYLIRIYQFGVGAAGILAVGVIVFGAIYYTVSAGSPDKQNDAKSYISGALWGLALLLGASLILNTINPEIAQIKLPGAGLKEGCGAGDRPGVDCLPIAAERSLPACEEGERACQLGETPEENNCVRCNPQLASCPAVFFNRGATPCGPGREPSQNCYCKPSVADYTGPIYFPNRVNPYNLENGTYWQYPFYPEDEERSEARCVIYAFKTRKDSEVNHVPDSVFGDLTSC